jgi:hypothetical protein
MTVDLVEAGVLDSYRITSIDVSAVVPETFINRSKGISGGSETVGCVCAGGSLVCADKIQLGLINKSEN